MAASAIMKSQMRMDEWNSSKLNEREFSYITVGKVKSDFFQDFNELNNIHPAKSFY